MSEEKSEPGARMLRLAAVFTATFVASAVFMWAGSMESPSGSWTVSWPYYISIIIGWVLLLIGLAHLTTGPPSHDRAATEDSMLLILLCVAYLAPSLIALFYLFP